MPDKPATHAGQDPCFRKSICQNDAAHHSPATRMPTRKTDIPPTVLLFGEVLFDAFPDRMVLGGAPFNVARHLHGFGIDARLVSRTGSDEHRARLLSAMAEFGMVNAGLQSDPVHPTGIVQVETGPEGHRFAILPDQAYDFIDASAARAFAGAAPADMVYFGTLAQRAATSRHALDAVLAGTGAPRLLDLNLRTPWYDLPVLERSLNLADTLKLNNEELTALTALLDLPRDSLAAGAELLRRYALQALLVTCGEQGAWLLDHDGNFTEAASIRLTSIADTVGAGDAFSAVFMAGTLYGWAPALTLQRANAFAAAICGLHGAIPEGDGLYRGFLRDWAQPATG